MKQSNTTRFGSLALLTLAGLSLSACRSQSYTSSLQLTGSERQEDIAEKVRATIEAQSESRKAFESASHTLAKLEGAQENREEVYEKLQNRIDICAQNVEETARRISVLREESSVLFTAWTAELDQFSNPRMRSRSAERMRTVKENYDQLLEQLDRTQTQMDVVLTAHRDYVLFFNHNMGADSLAALEGENQLFTEEMDQLHAEVLATGRNAETFLVQLEGKPAPIEP